MCFIIEKPIPYHQIHRSQTNIHAVCNAICRTRILHSRPSLFNQFVACLCFGGYKCNIYRYVCLYIIICFNRLMGTTYVCRDLNSIHTQPPAHPYQPLITKRVFLDCDCDYYIYNNHNI